MIGRAMLVRLAATTLSSMLLLTGPGTIAAETHAEDVAEDVAIAMRATVGFIDLHAAEEAGYALPTGVPLEKCIASLDGTGAMGFHHINSDLVGDASLDPGRPEVLVYAPTADGGRELVALEYVVFADAWDALNDQPPMLFEHELMFTEEPNRYELPPFYSLHAWVWRENPAGLFASFDPEVTCTPGEDVAEPGETTPVLPSGA